MRFWETLGLGERLTHKDGNKLNNHVDNLEWATYSHNNNHARATGLNNQNGEFCNLTKFTNDTVRAIRDFHSIGVYTYKQLGEMFGVSTYHVGEIIRGESRASG